MKKRLAAAGVFAIAAILVGGGSGYFTSKSEKETRSTSASADHKTSSNPSPPAPESAAGSQSAHPATQSPPQASSLSPASQEKTAQIAERLSPAFNKPVSIEHGGALRELILAKDELYVRNTDGIGRVVSIPPAASAADLLSSIDKVQKETGAAPELILYPSGTPRNEFTRLIVTRQVVLNAPSRAEADTLAAAQGLLFQKAPIFAPNAFVYEAATSAEALVVQTKQDSPIVATTLLARKAATLSSPNDPYYKLQWHLKFQNQPSAVTGTDINVESVWNYPETDTTKYNRGQDVTIGIVDDSFEWPHPDLAPNTKKELQYDWNGKDNDPKPDDFYSEAHGTSVGGVAAARGNNRIGVSGVAPEAGLAGMRLIASDFTDLDEAEAMLWKAEEIHVKNNSWHHPLQSNDFWFPTPGIGPLSEAALKYAATFGRNGKGTILIFAAGNSDTEGSRPDYKAEQNSIYTIAVGAVGSDQLKSDYSEKGACVVVSAPSSSATGRGVMTTDNRGLYGYNDGFSGVDVSGDGTKYFGGTSSAAPVVSGVVALMLQAKPTLGWRDVQEILMRSATKIDLADTDWKTPVAPDSINHSHKYGAGLVNATAAVDLAKNWTNLSPQKSLTVTTNNTTPISANATNVTRTFTVSGDELRVEHVTLRLTVEDIKKGGLEITLTSPDGTVSVFCLEHNDQISDDPRVPPGKGWGDLSFNGDGDVDDEELFDPNEFENWTFMTVRNWGEGSNGVWTLTINNTSAYSGNLTDAELVVYGSDADALVDAPAVTLAASRTEVFVGSNLTLTATAKDRNNDRIENVEAYEGVNSLGVSANGTWTIQANKAGNYTFTVNATDGSGAVATSNALEVAVIEAPIAAWDFDTSRQSPFPLATVVQGAKKYAANFGSGNMTFNGDFTDLNQDIRNLWSHQTGEIGVADGTDANAVGDMRNNRLRNEGLQNTALLIRGGKNIGAQGKSIVFQFSMENRDQLFVSYASAADADGFNSHAWSWSTDGENWTNHHPLVPNSIYDSQTLPVISDLADQATAYLRVEFTGTTAASGQNLIDNVILSASPITIDPVSENFTVLARAAAKAQGYGLGSQTSQANETTEATSQAESGVSEDSQSLDWVLEKPSIHEMVVHAEVVEGGQFLNAPGSLLSANEDGKVLGLAEPILQSTRYELGITSADPAPEPLRLKVYDSKSKAVLVLEEKVPFAPGSTIGSPSTPKRYKVAYQEAEQVVLVAPGWNTFTTAVDPDPATLEGALIDYDATEGDRLVGPEANATVIQGKWNPTGLELKPQATYTLLRQAPSGSQILLKGKALPEATPKPPHDRYGIWMDLPNGSIITMDWCDADGDQIDDRFQPGPGMPMQRRAPMPLAPVSTAQPAPAASSAGASNSATKASNSTKGSKKSKSATSSKSKFGKKSKSKAKS